MVNQDKLKSDMEDFFSSLSRNELVKMGQSRDAWANHTTVQSTNIQKLQAENDQLKEGKADRVRIRIRYACSVFCRVASD